MEKIVLGLTGTNGAGKSTVASALVQLYGADHRSARALLRGLLDAQGIAPDRSTQRDLANQLRRDGGPHALARLMLPAALDAKSDLIVIDSVRSIREVWYLRAEARARGYQFYLVACDAPLEDRLVRMAARGSETDRAPLLDLVAQENRELYGAPTEQSLASCLACADVTIRLPEDPYVADVAATAVRYLMSVLTLESPGSSTDAHWWVHPTGARHPSAEPYVHLIPLWKLGALDGQPYDIIGFRQPVTVEVALDRLATAHVRPAPSAPKLTHVLGNVHESIALLGPTDLACVRDGAAGYLTTPEGMHEVLGYQSELLPDTLLAYYVPWI